MTAAIGHKSNSANPTLTMLTVMLCGLASSLTQSAQRLIAWLYMRFQSC